MPDKAYGFNAEDVRRIAEAVIASERRLQGGDSDAASSRRYDGAQWLPFKNVYAGSCPGYSCGRISTYSVIGSQIVLSLDRPSTTFARDYALTNCLAAAQNESGLCLPDSCGLVTYDTGTPAVGETWGPKPSQWTISKNYPGYEILGIVDSTNKIALVRPIPMTHFHGKADSAIAKGSSGTVSIWIGAGGSESDSTWDVTAYARGAAITSGKIVTVDFINGVPYVGCWEA